MAQDAWVSLKEAQLESSPSWNFAWSAGVRSLVDKVYSKAKRPMPRLGYTFEASYNWKDPSQGAYIQVWEPLGGGGEQHVYSISSRTKKCKDKTVPGVAAYRALPRGSDTSCLGAICDWLFATHAERVVKAKRAERKRRREADQHSAVFARKLAKIKAGYGTSSDTSNICESCGYVKTFCAAPKCLELSLCPECEEIDEVWQQHEHCERHPSAVYCQRHRGRYIVQCRNCEEFKMTAEGPQQRFLWRCKAKCMKRCEGCDRRVCYNCLEEGLHDCDEYRSDQEANSSDGEWHSSDEEECSTEKEGPSTDQEEYAADEEEDEEEDEEDEDDEA